MRHARNIFVFLICFVMITPFFANAEDEFSGEDLSTKLEIREDDRYLVYGEYAEIEITSQDSIELTYTNDIKAFGMEIEKIDSSTHILFGQVEFVGKLCFLLNAEDNYGDVSTERVCLYSEDNDELQYPRYVGQRFLDSVEEGTRFTKTFDIETYDREIFQSLKTPLSGALNMNRDSRGKISVSGRLNNSGVVEFVVKTQELNSEVTVYKQFILEVTDIDTSYSCAPGYYWDSYLRYCVQAGGRTCGVGTWYDYDSNTCRAYNTRRWCRAGSYWDHWLNRCVISSAMRCPINYEWDRYYSRCVRLPYTCSYNEAYNYSLRRCVPLYRHRICNAGYHWNSYRGRCIRNTRSCRIGEFWNGRRCERNIRTCRSGRYYDPVRRRCLPRATVRTCRPGTHWDYRTSQCIRRAVTSRICGSGSRYSNRLGRCVSHDARRVNRHPRRPHRPVVTRPNRPNRPTTRPDRPNTRPNRPTTRPNRPTTRPNRPTTRPNRPTTRPTQPTTRPSRPTTRPSQPTTRPSRPTTRPSQPTTRPSRPTTRPSQPTTRPSRPTTRPSRPTTRPSQPTTRPSRPSTRPSQPTTRPSRPSTRPSRPSTSPSRPTTRPSRPSTSPSRPTTRPSRPSRDTGSTTRPSRNSGGSSSGSDRPRRCRRNCGE